MTDIAVTVVSSGGLPVTDVSTSNNLGLPVTVVDSGGLPVTLVSSGGLPVIAGGIGGGIRLSASQNTDGDAQGTAIGTLSVSGGTGTYTFTLTNTGGGTTQVAGTNGVNLQVGATAPSIGTTTIGVHADNGAGSTFDATFTISTVPQSVSIDLVAVSDSGASSTDNVTNDNSPQLDFTFGSTPVAGDILELRDGSITIVSHTISADEITLNSVFLDTPSLADDVHSLSARHSRGSLVGAWGGALSVTVDTVAPTLSAFSIAQDGTTKTISDISITTNDGTGTLYVVASTSSTPPSAAQIIAGEDSSGSPAASAQSYSISSAGAKSLVIGVSSNGTYFGYAVHVDLAGNISAVASSTSWVVAGVAPPAASFETMFGNESIGFSNNVNFTIGLGAANNNNRLLLVYVHANQGGNLGAITATIDPTGAPIAMTQIVSVANDGTSSTPTALFAAVVPNSYGTSITLRIHAASTMASAFGSVVRLDNVNTSASASATCSLAAASHSTFTWNNSLSIPSGGIGVAFSHWGSAGTNQSDPGNYSNLTTLDHSNDGTNAVMTGDTNAGGSVTPEITVSPAIFASVTGLAASFAGA